MDPQKRLQTGFAVTTCASRGLAAALTVGESSRHGAEASGRIDIRSGQLAGIDAPLRFAENAGHLTTAFALGR